jgi:hypothetical protein
LRKSETVTVDKEVSAHTLQANSSGIEHLAIRDGQVTGSKILTESISRGALRTGPSCIVIYSAIDDIKDADISTDLEAFKTAETGPVGRRRGAVGRKKSTDVVAGEVVALDAGKTDVGTQVVGLAVEEGTAKYAEAIVDDVVCDAGLAST